MFMFLFFIGVIIFRVGSSYFFFRILFLKWVYVFGEGVFNVNCCMINRGFEFFFIFYCICLRIEFKVKFIVIKV